MSGLVLPPTARPITETRCERCRHSAPAQQPGQIECRRFPPQVVVASPGQLVALFPLVGPDQCCGEFAKRIVLDS